MNELNGEPGRYASFFHLLLQANPDLYFYFPPAFSSEGEYVKKAPHDVFFRVWEVRTKDDLTKIRLILFSSGQLSDDLNRKSNNNNKPQGKKKIIIVCTSHNTSSSIADPQTKLHKTIFQPHACTSHLSSLVSIGTTLSLTSTHPPFPHPR